MNYLHVFGDSFADACNPDSWVHSMANKLNLRLNSHALGGSSIEYSYLKLLDNFNKFKEGDVVIFIITSPDRFDLGYYISKMPSSAWQAKNIDSYDTIDKDYLKWYITARDNRLLENKAMLYMSFIHSLSIMFLNTKFIVMSSFKESLKSGINYNTNNFINLSSVSLNEISNYEWDLNICNSDMLSKYFGIDPRTNHLTNPNLEILSEILTSIVETNNSSLFVKENFKKNVVNHNVMQVSDIKKFYIDTNLITNSIIKKVA